MADDAEQFSRLAGAVVARMFARHGKALPAMVAGGEFGARLWQAVVEGGGLPSAHAGPGLSRGSPEEAWSPLVARVVGGESDALFAAVTKQLLKACLYPPPAACCDSYREAGADGLCRRQELSRVRSRISGAHCVDCPHWVGLSREPHIALLQAEWRGAVRNFFDHQSDFLPEDFRDLRLWLEARLRVRSSDAQ